jgi:hypothetical protein
LKVFLSSTFQDLVEHRSLAEASLATCGIPFNAMEHFGSTPQPPIDTCLAAVDASDVFVGVLGVRYGGSPPGLMRSYTEREYLRALGRGIPVFVFLIDETLAAVAPHHYLSETQDQQLRLQRFKDNVKRKHTVSFFRTPDDLARLILASFIRELGVIP